MAAVVGIVAVGASSCGSILGVGEHENGAAALCAFLADCYGGFDDCEAFVGARLDAGDPALRGAFLRALAEDGCLTSCEEAKRCLDAAPVCLSTAEGAACATYQQCCDFHVGKSRCSEGRCCLDLGVPCSADGACCVGVCAPSKDGSGVDTCGGEVVCKEPGDECERDKDCCTDSCVGGVCSESICSPPGGPCSDGQPCCLGMCEMGVCAQGCAQVQEPCAFSPCCDPTFACIADACTPPGECVLDEQACIPYDPSSVCCNGLPCNAFSATCSFSTCSFDGQYCDDVMSVCCSGMPCDMQTLSCPIVQCLPASSSCAMGDLPCCAPNVCNQATLSCTLECDGLPLDDLCAPGPDMTPASTSVGPHTECVQQVCQTDAYCCCADWDGICVDEAKTICNLCN